MFSMRVGWKFSITGNGEQFVMMGSITRMLKSYADNLVILGAVCTAVLRLARVLARSGWMICSVAAVSLNSDYATTRMAAGDATTVDTVKMWAWLAVCIRICVSRKVSKRRDSGLEICESSEIWQASRQQRCRDACQVSEKKNHYSIQSRGFETSWEARPLIE